MTNRKNGVILTHYSGSYDSKYNPDNIGSMRKSDDAIVNEKYFEGKIKAQLFFHFPFEEMNLTKTLLSPGTISLVLSNNMNHMQSSNRR